MENTKKYDLEERTCIFGENCINFAKKIPKNNITMPIINQFIRSATSIGANYCEADCAESRRDFEHKLGICKKECKETKHWFKMISVATPELKNEILSLLNEANELRFIFIAIINKSRANSD